MGKIRPSRRSDAITESITLAISARAAAMKAAGEDVISLGAGEPDFPTYEPVAQAGIDAIRDGVTRYTASSGLPQVRDAACEWFRQFGLEFERHNVMLTAGAKPALTMALMALVDPGDCILTPAPYWPSYPEMIKLAGATSVDIPSNPENQFVPTREEIVSLAREHGATGIIINFPNNPSGAVPTRAQIEEIVEAARWWREAGSDHSRVEGVGAEGGTDQASSAAVDMGDLRERVLEAATRSSEQNKAAFLPPLRATRADGPPRKRVVKSFTFPPGAAPDMADIDLFAEWQWAINIARGSAPFAGVELDSIDKTGNVDIARVSFQPNPASDFAPKKMKWGMRRYNLGDTTVTDCDFTGIPEEHGIYDNLSGHGLYRGNTFLNLGGQGIQIAHRDEPYQQYKADNIRLKASPLIVQENNHAVDCGRNAARSGFTWTFFDAGSWEHPSTIVLRGCTAVAAWDFTRTAGGEIVEANHPEAIRSPGGLMVHNYRPRPKGAENFPTEHLVLDACLFDPNQRTERDRCSARSR